MSPQAAAGEEVQQPADWYAQALIYWGNNLYEQSQVNAAVGLEWASILDEAVARFRQAGAPEADIKTAVESHLVAKEYTFPEAPEPVPEPAKVTLSGFLARPECRARVIFFWRDL